MNKKTIPILTTNIPQLKLCNRGKVRDIYEINDTLLIIATDRISAFDVVLPNGIPYKGKVLTGLSEFWFKYTSDIIENHLITTQIEKMNNDVIARQKDILQGRSMLVKKVAVIPVECIIRGYLAGSGWKEYQKTQSICGIKLPAGLKESDKLPEPIFTPSTKATTGHDENIPFSRVIDMVGKKLAEELKEKSMKIYLKASDYARDKGIIICDTKFEWGVTKDNKTILIDEALTPDSSRFWPQEGYEPGKPQHSYDKQFIRDYLESIYWDKKPPAPALPPDIIQKTSEKYLSAYNALTGKSLI
ncbi:MAG: phosphoribosylaminoimidazolesuccinocarboxamide synthase [Candidatus Brocadia sp. AMX2]|uniref:Phosphoribosylaminoimidazole-succinocarboxamide synthase n=1 Tax=Candidatus Brocadia sinica JPN1 TaxID=1197129 RepID=A0ABQ0JY64_9BACT|nr:MULTISPECIES: phosphoribosylaminoimidazolesuccinocarboxamide synthase [Brocadia]KXK29940.1 MAG: phosphoribosylaminoimidazole-succinocarboxamide synthase [Candidatus Brocadia sinica]MBC6931385.1 phosphoribosylaminoimidazolesuccinocarboxamide synthase [Candidatus Brocadia sp.]MBL1167559.1 phosphoribosylaminoimidazolesuccinocarboxamide synthase [Candidatus Brocadia sp. AMX1]NOG40549.1 phosphoribosylaminoimidazolesuccinocarboxamide synthase [Planctomycetota bacterium]KAA0244116.1 MAG: phosphori